jgi:hypothetical protein
MLLRQLLDENPGAQRVRLELAALQLRLGDEEGARRMLRAASAGSLPREVARLVQRWSEVLRSRKPSGFNLELSLAPDSNINRATRSDTLGTVLGDFALDPDGRARSGVGLGVGMSAYRRVPVGAGASLVGRLTGSGQFYREKQFNQVDAEEALGAELTLGRNRLLVEGGAGQSWFGGELYQRQMRATALIRRPLGPRTEAGLRVTGAAFDNRFNAFQDGRSITGELSLEHAFTARSGILLTGTGERFKARDPGYATRRWQLSATGWQELGATTIFAGAAFSRLKGDEPLLLFPDARRDRLLRLSAGATLRGLSFGNFASFLRVMRERNLSNLELHDYARTRTEVGFTRAF